LISVQDQSALAIPEVTGQRGHDRIDAGETGAVGKMLTASGS
jgi:hypothetical protein